MGPGVVVFEVQQNSDVTYRVYDWGRMGLDGKPRALHLDKAWDVMEFGDTGPDVLSGAEADESASPARRLFRDAAPFHLEVARGPGRVSTPPGKFEIISVLAGTGKFVSTGGEEARLAAGDSALVPASWDGYEVRCDGPMEWVRTWVV